LGIYDYESGGFPVKDSRLKIYKKNPRSGKDTEKTDSKKILKTFVWFLVGYGKMNEQKLKSVLPMKNRSFSNKSKKHPGFFLWRNHPRIEFTGRTGIRYCDQTGSRLI
jgi:hypothetical protein